jgi:diguanylate cyclase (GGDEF)-like protein
MSIGPGHEVDVELADDATERELVTVCRLLAEIVGLRRQLAEDRRLRDQLRDQALTDSLSGLPNRRAWENELACRFEASLETGQGLCVALVDLDHFKRVNDGHGHGVGDDVLRAAGHALQESLRSGDFVARLGGDEFGLLVRGVDPARCAKIIDRVRKAINLHSLPSREMTASAGFACADPDAEVAETVARADEALRRAKRQGRNRTCRA